MSEISNWNILKIDKDDLSSTAVSNPDDLLLVTEDASLKICPNENLVSDPNFKLNGLSIWRSGSCTRTYIYNGVRLAMTANWGYMSQELPYALALDGKMITLSASVRIVSGSGDCRVVLSTHDSSASSGHIDLGVLRITSSSSTFQTISITRKVTLGDKKDLYVWLTSNTSGTIIEYEWVKLEIGNHATIFYPPDPVLEWKKCQKHYCVANQCGILIGYRDIGYNGQDYWPIINIDRFPNTIKPTNLYTTSVFVNSYYPEAALYYLRSSSGIRYTDTTSEVTTQNDKPIYTKDSYVMKGNFVSTSPVCGPVGLITLFELGYVSVRSDINFNN